MIFTSGLNRLVLIFQRHNLATPSSATANKHFIVGDGEGENTKRVTSFFFINKEQ